MDKSDNVKDVVFGLGNMLLDIIVEVPEKFLNKYELEADSIQIAESKHLPLFEDISDTGFRIDYVPGGCALNTIRIAQWILKKSKATAFVGAIGDDEAASKLTTILENEGMHLECQRILGSPTGRCAVLINGKTRTLVTQLGAAMEFNHDIFLKSNAFSLLRFAKIIYISVKRDLILIQGYFLKVSPVTAMEVTKYGRSKGCPIVLNLNAIWVTESCKDKLLNILPYVDYLIGNQSEIHSFARQNGSSLKDIFEIVPWLSQRLSRDDLVIIVTRGELPLICSKGNEVTQYPIISVDKDKFVDTNGAGDAFAGGFLAGLEQEAPLEGCIHWGLWAAAKVIQQKGCNFPKICPPMDF